MPLLSHFPRTLVLFERALRMSGAFEVALVARFEMDGAFRRVRQLGGGGGVGGGGRVAGRAEQPFSDREQLTAEFRQLGRRAAQLFEIEIVRDDVETQAVQLFHGLLHRLQRHVPALFEDLELAAGDLGLLRQLAL